MLANRTRLLPLLFALAACPGHRSLPNSGRPGASSRAHHVALRLVPGQDLKLALLDVVKAEGLEAAAVVSAVGSLTTVTLRFANQPEVTTRTGPFEIVSLVGTLGPDGAHLHVALSDGAGATIGGHLADGSLVYTTVEVVLVELDDLRFLRELDPATTYNELAIEPRDAKEPR